ncbi:MAG TPA: glycosyltransferase family 1 protein [Terriglobales bacterium]|nr:glycosyltransferase family 1 protein [Terriglobales bacterium]
MQSPAQAISCRPKRVAIVCDFAEENWPSMDLVADMLYQNLSGQHTELAVGLIRPMLRYGATSPGKASRLYGRFVQYARHLRTIRDQFDLFHIVDHSYSQLVHDLPPERTIVTCHDLDTFRCLIEPAREPRSFAYRLMTRRILRGFQMAAHVVCNTVATHDQILRHQLIAANKLTVIHNGVHPDLSPESDAADHALAETIQRPAGVVPELLHVGSTIPRKRIDLLLKIFASVRQQLPSLRLLRVGTPFTIEQQRLMNDLQLTQAIDFIPRLTPSMLAAAYRRASATLQPSEAEGFGLPVIESMACGTPVVASDIPALREIGGANTCFCPAGDIGRWTDAILRTLASPPSHTALREHARHFSWEAHAAKVAQIYERVLAK